MEKLRAIDPLAQDWTLLVLLIVLGILGWINLVSPKKWRLLTRSFFSLRLGRQSLRDELDLQDRTLIALAVMASAMLALFGYQFAVLVAHLPSGIGLWAKIFGASVLLTVVQVLLVRFVGGLFQADGGLGEYLYTLLLFHVGLGLVLLPITAVLAYPHVLGWRPWVAWAGLGVVALVTGFRWVRAAAVGMGEGVPLRYIFIYLCALEILPVALAYQQARHLLLDPSHLL